MYSKTVLQKVENLCVRCETKFEQWSAYHRHVLNGGCKLVIRPINTSGRRKAEIVRDWETRQKEGAIIQ